MYASRGDSSSEERYISHIETHTRRITRANILASFFSILIRVVGIYSTVTDLARLRGWSTLQPRSTAM